MDSLFAQMDLSHLTNSIRPKARDPLLLPSFTSRAIVEEGPGMTRARKKSTIEEKDKGAATRSAATGVAKATKKKRKTTLEEEEKKMGDGWKEDAMKTAAAFVAKYAALGIEGIKAEYKSEIQAYRSPLYGDAAFRANTSKNRHKDPPTCLDDTRVALGEKGYINASWMYDQTRIPRQYILTQTPLESTIEDFWKMIFEHKVMAIAVLCDKTENGQEMMPDFWPTDNGNFKSYGEIAVSNKKTEVIQKESVTTLEVLPEGCSNSHITCIVQCKAWETTFTQTTARAHLKIIRVFSKLEKTMTGPVCVMDDYSAISRASVMSVVDVMGGLIYKADKTTLPEVARWARRCRNGAIRSEDDYLAVIRTIFEYLYRSHPDKYAEAYEKICGKEE